MLRCKNVVDRFGTIDVLVNCAGVLGPIGPTVAVPMDAWVESRGNQSSREFLPDPCRASAHAGAQAG
jgi:hypothetical protein